MSGTAVVGAIYIDDRRDARGISRREEGRQVSPERIAHQGHTTKSQRVDRGADVREQRVEWGSAIVRSRRTERTRRHRDDAIPIGEARREVLIYVRRVPKTGKEEERWSVPAPIEDLHPAAGTARNEFDASTRVRHLCVASGHREGEKQDVARVTSARIVVPDG